MTIAPAKAKILRSPFQDDNCDDIDKYLARVTVDVAYGMEIKNLLKYDLHRNSIYDKDGVTECSSSTIFGGDVGTMLGM